MQTTYAGGDELSRVERVAHNRGGLWVAIIITVVGLLLFTGIFNLILPNFGDTLNGTPLIVLGLIFSLVPAAIWIYFFYRLDRLEAEPKHLVFTVFIVGALVTAALHDPIIDGLYGVSQWKYNSWWGHLLGGILIVGVVEQAIIWATVRFTVFRNPEFDERVDGVIYSVAAGLGLATILNFQYVIRSGGVDLDIGSMRMVVNALAYASFAGIMGYFLGQARFEKTPIYYLPAGVMLAAVVNGYFWYLLERSASTGLQATPGYDLLIAALVAFFALAIVFWLIERANEETLRVAHQHTREGIGMVGPPLVPAPATATGAPVAQSTTTPAVAVYTADTENSVEATAAEASIDDATAADDAAEDTSAAKPKRSRGRTKPAAGESSMTDSEENT